MIITVSGMSGSGKSSTADAVAERLGVKAVDVGRLFRDMAATHDMSVLEFGAYAAANPEVDRELDAQILRLARQDGKTILQSRLSGALTHREGVPAFRIWLDASEEIRAGRVAKREGVPLAQALADTRRRDAADRARFLQLYGLDVTDLSVYDAVVHTDNRSIAQVVTVLLKEIAKVWPKNRTTKPKKRPSRRKPPPSPRPKPRKPLRKRSKSSRSPRRTSGRA